MAAENILVVDDEPVVGIAFQRELCEKGYRVDSVLSGQEALKGVQNKKYDLVFIDQHMPGMDGVETCREIKKVSPDSILIFMTGLFGKENVIKEQRFIEEGGRSYYLYKPFAQGELQKVAAKALGERSK